MEAADLRGKTQEELLLEAGKLAAKIYELRCALTMSDKATPVHHLREAKKDRAKVLTVLREKQLSEAKDTRDDEAK